MWLVSLGPTCVTSRNVECLRHVGFQTHVFLGFFARLKPRHGSPDSGVRPGAVWSFARVARQQTGGRSVRRTAWSWRPSCLFVCTLGGWCKGIQKLRLLCRQMSEGGWPRYYLGGGTITNVRQAGDPGLRPVPGRSSCYFVSSSMLIGGGLAPITKRALWTMATRACTCGRPGQCAKEPLRPATLKTDSLLGSTGSDVQGAAAGKRYLLASPSYGHVDRLCSCQMFGKRW